MIRIWVLCAAICSLSISACGNLRLEEPRVFRFPFYLNVGDMPREVAQRIEYIWSSAIDSSMARVISNPKVFDEKSVRVTGVFSYTELGAALFLDRESYEYGVIHNAIALSLPNSYIEAAMIPLMEGNYVEIVGVFDADADLSRFPFNGMISEILPVVPAKVHKKMRDAAG